MQRVDRWFSSNLEAVNFRTKPPLDLKRFPHRTAFLQPKQELIPQGEESNSKANKKFITSKDIIGWGGNNAKGEAIQESQESLNAVTSYSQSKASLAKKEAWTGEQSKALILHKRGGDSSLFNKTHLLSDYA